MIFDLALLLTWVAAGYRVWVLVTQPRRVWRTAFSLSMVATALAFTIYRFRLRLDELLGVPNLSGLLAHIIFALGGGLVLIYLDALRLPVVTNRRIAVYLATASAAAVIMASAWLAAPVHEVTMDDFLPLVGDRSVVVYCVTFWAYLVWTLAVMAWTCLARGRTFRREDLARSISLLLIGISALTAIPVVLLWTASVLVRHVTDTRGGHLNALGDALLPWPVLLNAAGVLSLLTVPYMSSYVRTWWRLRRLQPLWQAMTLRYPQVHLELRPTGGPLARLQTRMERAIIEIHDALRLASAGPTEGDASTPSVKALASALRQRGPGGPRVADLLERVETREADVSQLLALARAFGRSRR